MNHFGFYLIIFHLLLPSHQVRNILVILVVSNNFQDCTEQLCSGLRNNSIRIRSTFVEKAEEMVLFTGASLYRIAMADTHQWAECLTSGQSVEWETFLYLYLLSNPVNSSQAFYLYGIKVGEFTEWRFINLGNNRTLDRPDEVFTCHEARCPSESGRYVMIYDREFFEISTGKGPRFQCLELLPYPRRAHALAVWTLSMGDNSHFDMEKSGEFVVKRSQNIMHFCPQFGPVNEDTSCRIQDSIEPTFDYYVSGFVFQKRLYVFTGQSVLVLDVTPIIHSVYTTTRPFSLQIQTLTIEEFLCEPQTLMPSSGFILILLILSITGVVATILSLRNKQYTKVTTVTTTTTTTSDPPYSARTLPKRIQRTVPPLTRKPRFYSSPSLSPKIFSNIKSTFSNFFIETLPRKTVRRNKFNKK